MKLRELREQAMYTQAEVARKLKVTNATVSLWESGGRYPRLDHMRELAKLYNVSPQVIKSAVEAARSSEPKSQD